MILHTINKSLFNSNCLHDCLALCAQQASVLLLEDGVYAATNSSGAVALINQHTHINFYALEADLLARGLMDKLNAGITVVDDRGFVDLCVTHSTVQSWY